MARKPIIAICTGDPHGIGPEITHKALSDERVHHAADFLVIGPTKTAPGQPEPTAEGGRVSFANLMEAIECVKRAPGTPGSADAIVTGPISKEAWHAAGIHFPGHTEALAQAFESPRSAMLFVGPSLRVILVTIHIPLAEVPIRITTAKVHSAIELGHRACRQLGVRWPRIAVAGLNPHAGEHGLFGTEDQRIIAPAVEQARREGMDVTGPIPGDVVFLKAARGHYDLCVAMYHDQGLIPMKLLDREHAVNVTVGLEWKGRDVVRTSPAHGTAYDIAGQGVADPSSMRAAIWSAIEMVRASHREMSPTRERGMS
jgi:4-hydroxythreonine-4-phosphate dehydrogenase